MLDAAARAFGFERMHLDPRPSDRCGLEPGASASGRDVLQIPSWCRGAAGIALSRVAALPELDSPEVRNELDAAIAAASVLRPGQLDTLCCGALGQAEALATCGLRLDRPELTHRALGLAGSILERARGCGSFGWRPRGFFNPGLLQGAAGIAYGLLRLADPAQAPAVLLWE
jgi:lantibiotic modifying enzyme